MSFRGADSLDPALRAALPVTEASRDSDSSTNASTLPESGLRSAQLRVPNELWCMIWAYLPLEGIVNVSHVCRAWRSLATGCPRLWCYLLFRTTIPAPECPCDECDSRNACSDDILVEAAGSSNLRAITEVLPRSQSLPLAVTIFVEHLYAEESVIEALAAALDDHAPRIRSISFLSEDADAPPEFFPNFSSLPNLRFLAVRCLDDLLAGGRALVHADDTSKLSLPALECLEISAGIGCKLQDLALLKTLAVPYISADGVLPLVLSAPNLEVLKLRLPDFHPWHEVDDECTRLNDACSRIPRISVFNISPDANAYASRLCTREHPDVTLFYSSSSARVTTEALTTIDRPMSLSIQSRAGDANADGGSTVAGVLLTLSDASHKRTLWVPRRCLPSAWRGYTPKHFAPQATIDLGLLALVPPSVAGGVTALVIMMPSAARRVPDDVPPFPVLERVEFRLKGRPRPGSCEGMFVDILAMLLCGAERRLQAMTFTNFPEDVDPEHFSPFAESVAVRQTDAAPGA